MLKSSIISDISSETEALLLQRVSMGEEHAFKILFDIYYQRLFHEAVYFLKNKEIAEEVVADVFYNIWKKREMLPTINDISSYLYTSVKNQSLHYIRRKLYDEEDLDLYKIELIPDDDDPELHLINKEYRTQVQEAIASLPEKCKEVFRLVLSDKLTHKQIAQLLDISEKTVQSHVTNAYKKISLQVNKQYQEQKQPPKIMVVLV